jgi:hypothetical protein
MAHGDTEVTKHDVIDVTIVTATKDGDADTKETLNSEQGKSSKTTCLVIGVKVWSADTWGLAKWAFSVIICLLARRDKYRVEYAQCFTKPVMQLNFRRIARLFSEWFWDGSSWLCYYWYSICLYIPHALYFCCRDFIFWNLLGLFQDHISLLLLLLFTSPRDNFCLSVRRGSCRIALWLRPYRFLPKTSSFTNDSFIRW